MLLAFCNKRGIDEESMPPRQIRRKPRRRRPAWAAFHWLQPACRANRQPLHPTPGLTSTPARPTSLQPRDGSLCGLCGLSSAAASAAAAAAAARAPCRVGCSRQIGAGRAAARAAAARLRWAVGRASCGRRHGLSSGGPHGRGGDRRAGAAAAPGDAEPERQVSRQRKTRCSLLLQHRRRQRLALLAPSATCCNAAGAPPPLLAGCAPSTRSCGGSARPRRA